MVPQHLPRSGRLLRQLNLEFGSVWHDRAAVLVLEQGVRRQAWSELAAGESSGREEALYG